MSGVTNKAVWLHSTTVYFSHGFSIERTSVTSVRVNKQFQRSVGDFPFTTQILLLTHLEWRITLLSTHGRFYFQFLSTSFSQSFLVKGGGIPEGIFIKKGFMCMTVKCWNRGKAYLLRNMKIHRIFFFFRESRFWNRSTFSGNKAQFVINVDFQPHS